MNFEGRRSLENRRLGRVVAQPPADPDLAARKQAIRLQARAALAAVSPARRAVEEETVSAALQATPEWRSAATVLLYAAKPPEFSVVGLTLAAWREGKRTLFPRVAKGVTALELCEVSSWSQLQVGAFGIKEPALAIPASVAAPDLCLVPGLAFDATGHRLGRGGGYYDALFAAGGGGARKWGIAFDVQLMHAVPWEPHDATMDDVWTCRNKRLLGT